MLSWLSETSMRSTQTLINATPSHLSLNCGTTGPFGPEIVTFLSKIGCCMPQTADWRSQIIQLPTATSVRCCATGIQPQ